MNELTQHIRRIAIENGHTLGKRLAVAFSGGLDSTALLKLAVGAFGPENVLAFHVDHGVRPRSREDEKHCRAVAKVLGADFHSVRLDPLIVSKVIKECGREGALRDLRYGALATLCEKNQLETLLVGHHAEDRVESHLLAMVRGSGLTGLAGPRTARSLRRNSSVRLLRPLLDVQRGDLREVVGDTPFVEDETNQDTSLQRNRIRHEVMSVLTEMAGSSAPLKRSMELLAEERDDLERLLASEMRRNDIDPTQDTLDFSALGHYDTPLISASLRAFFQNHGANYPPTRKMLARIVEAIKQPGRTRLIDAPKFRLRVSRHRVQIDNLDGIVEREQPPVGLGVGQTALLGLCSVRAELTDTPDGFHDNKRVFFDLDELGADTVEDLELRYARPGDRFSPFGLNGSVRLFRWLASQQVEMDRRSEVPVVVGGDEILWVVGFRRAQAAPITTSTRRVLVLEVTNDGFPR